MLNSLGTEIVAGIVVAVGAVIVDRLRRRALGAWRRRGLGKVLGLGQGQLCIVHSAIRDNERDGYNIPASCSQAARLLAVMLDELGLTEGKDYHVLSEPEVEERRTAIARELWQHNLLILCGPKRSSIAATALEAMPRKKFDMTLDPATGENSLTDLTRGDELFASRERDSLRKPGTTGDYDYALLASYPSARDPKRRVTVVAGIHGAGTVGAATFLSRCSKESQQLQKLLRKMDDDQLSAVLKVTFSRSQYSEDVIETTLL